jgi:hypothetical protein
MNSRRTLLLLRISVCFTAATAVAAASAPGAAAPRLWRAVFRLSTAADGSGGLRGLRMRRALPEPEPAPALLPGRAVRVSNSA